MSEEWAVLIWLIEREDPLKPLLFESKEAAQTALDRLYEHANNLTPPAEGEIEDMDGAFYAFRINRLLATWCGPRRAL